MLTAHGIYANLYNLQNTGILHLAPGLEGY